LYQLKTGGIHILKIIILFISLNTVLFSFGQGRVVINEYMPWTSNGCGTTAEFVELLNFGPGPVNIGCYILTDGDYSVTIPANTILQPGQFYVIAGQDVIPKPCANIDSTIHANLNWNSCGCTSSPIPTTGDGFFTDGGMANEQVVLLDPNLNMVDAVVRDMPAEPSSTINTAATSICQSKTFNLDSMHIRYETLGMSTGRGNSFARKLDGDCGWEKDPQQSANATNNTSGTTSDISYSLTIVKSMDCDSTHGSIDVYVSVSNYTNVFPMNYTIAKDANNDGVFDFSDTYTHGVDSTPPSIAITGLPMGRYKITVASVNGCYLKTFDVSILQCSGPLSTGPLVYFKLLQQQAQSLRFEWLLRETEKIRSIILDKSRDGYTFVPATKLDSLNFTGTKSFEQIISRDRSFSYYRLRLTDKSGKLIFSPVISTSEDNISTNKIWPNPVTEQANIQLDSDISHNTSFKIYNSNGNLVQTGNFFLQTGISTYQFSTRNLTAGTYQMLVLSNKDGQPIYFRFVKP
jgi:hypothetical protein